MIKKLFLLFIGLALSTNCFSQQYNLSPTNQEFMIGAPVDSASGTFAIDSALSFGTSGDAYGVVFIAQEAVSNATLPVYLPCVTETGTPSGMVAEIYGAYAGSGDDDRPVSGALYSVTGVNADGCVNNFVRFDIPGVSLVAGTQYWLVFSNGTGTPTSNFVTTIARANLVPTGFATTWQLYQPFSTTDGFATDPTLNAAAASPVVIKYPNSVQGFPYIVRTAHANNANDRGIRVKFNAPMRVIGAVNGQTSVIAASPISIYQGSTLVSTFTVPLMRMLNSIGGLFTDAPVLNANTAYDIVFDPSANTTVFPLHTAGSSPQVDVTAACWQNITHVDGATPGSYTETTCALTNMGIVFRSVPQSQNTLTGGCTITGQCTIN